MPKIRQAILAALIALGFAAVPAISHAQTTVSAQQKKKVAPKAHHAAPHRAAPHRAAPHRVQRAAPHRVHKQQKVQVHKERVQHKKVQQQQHKQNVQQLKHEQLKAQQHKGKATHQTAQQREHLRKLKAEQHRKSLQVHKQNLEKQRADRARLHEKARLDRQKLLNQRKLTGVKASALAQQRALRRANTRITMANARRGRFANRFGNRNLARVRRAGWAPLRAWRRGYRAAFVAWVGPVFWPYAYVDLFNYTFWPDDYYDGYWSYAYDDFFDGIWWESEPVYAAADEEEDAAGAPPRVSQAAPAERRKPPVRVSEATRGEAACGETGKGVTAWPFDRIQTALHLSEDQKDLMDELKQAALQAAESLRTACPKTQPHTPVERLQAISDRLEATHDAIKIVRPPLDKFYASLDEGQRERFAALGPRIKTNGEQKPGQEAGDACREAKPGLVNLPIQKIQELVKPTDQQMDLLDALEDASLKAVETLKAACPEQAPKSPAERLAATQARIEAMIKAADAMRPALEDFYASLNEQQKKAFDTMRS
jgi:LTXXQ motif family protein